MKKPTLRAEPLFEATILPARALTWAGTIYVAGETAALPESEADALEIAGIVRIGPRVAVPVKQTRPRSGKTSVRRGE
jgi:hypothetical protein